VRGIIQATAAAMTPFFWRTPRIALFPRQRTLPSSTTREKTNGTDKLQQGSRIAMRAANRARR